MSETRKLKISLIGPYPPPFGGISVHIQRLKSSLDAAGHETAVYDLQKDKNSEPDRIIGSKQAKMSLVADLFFSRKDIVHCFNTGWKMRVAMGLVSMFGKKTVVSIHGANLDDFLAKAGRFKKEIVAFFLKRVSFFIAANGQIEKTLLSLGIGADRVAVIPAFIPPITNDNDFDIIPGSASDFIATHYPIISANAFRLDFYHGHDLYGVDLCVELCARLKHFYPRLGIICCLAQVDDREYYDRLNQRIEEKYLADDFLFVTHVGPFHPILRKSQLFVRPTNTDGDAVSLREALFFDIPAIASDIISRPEGTILFGNRNIDDFTAKAKEALANRGNQADFFKKSIKDDNYRAVERVYLQLTEKKDEIH